MAELQLDLARVRVAMESRAHRRVARARTARRLLGAAAAGVCCAGVVAVGVARRRGESTSDALRAFGSASTRLVEVFALGGLASLTALGSSLAASVALTRE